MPRRRLFLLLLLAALLLLFVYQWRGGDAPASVGPGGEHTPRARAVPRVHEREAAPAPSTDEPFAPVKLAGETLFQRRLSAGTAIRKLRDPERLAGVWHALLRADGLPRRMRPGRAHEYLASLSDEPVDPDALRLMAAGSGRDALGSGLLVRVWSKGSGLSQEEVVLADRTLQHILTSVGIAEPSGFDVVASPEMGLDVFRRQPTIPWAVGLYFIEDRYCVVQTRVPPWYRVEVLKHELIHAALHQHRFDVVHTRFVSEGLAEYLRVLRPGDSGLEVPPGRFRDNFAVLLRKIARLEDGGIDVRQIRPARLLGLSARDFYALRQFSYLVAQATMAYVGPSVVSEALRSGQPAHLEDAVHRVHWSALLEFVARFAKGGREEHSVSVMDAPGPEAGEPGEVTALFKRLGVDVDPDAKEPHESILAYRPQRLDEEGAAALLEEFPSDEPVLVLTDMSEAMDGAFSGSGIELGNRRTFVDSFVIKLKQRLKVELVGLTAAPAHLFPPLGMQTQPFSAATMPRWLAGRKYGALVWCVAGRDGAARKAGKVGEVYAAMLEQFPLERAPTLVIDLADGQGDALELARAVSASHGYLGPVAYWNPQK